MKERGVLYFLTAWEGHEQKVMDVHGSLLIRSLESLKRHMSDIPTILFTNIDSVDWKSQGFDEVVHKYDPPDVWTYKYECLLETPFARTIHMDCDTYVCSPFYEVFTMLDGVNFAAPLSPWYTRRMPYSVPMSFPELAGGFIAYNYNDKVKELLEYTKVLVTKRRWGSDEPYLRKALYETDVKFSVLPWEYNCVFLLPGFVISNVRILHGKGSKETVELLEKSMGEHGTKIFTGDTLMHCEMGKKRKHKIGLTQKY